MKKLFLTLLLGISALGMVSCEVDDTTQKINKSNQNQTIESNEKVKEAIKVSAGEVLSAYKENGIAAFDKYGNRLLEITGICGDINKDIANKAYVIVKSGDDLEITELQCYFDNENEIKELKKGNRVTIRGKITDANPIFNIPVRDCVLVK